jgi:hypothetical protein
VHLFERTVRGAHRAPERVGGLDDEFVRQHVEEHALRDAVEGDVVLTVAKAEEREALEAQLQVLDPLVQPRLVVVAGRWTSPGSTTPLPLASAAMNTLERP